MTKLRLANLRWAGVSVLSVALALTSSTPSTSGPTSGPASAAAAVTSVATWASSPTDMAGPYSDKTVRNIVHTAVGGRAIQLRLSNAFGSIPVRFDSVWVGVQSSGAGVVQGTNRRAKFGGSTGVTVPVGANVLSDPIDLTAYAGQNLSVSIHVAGDTGKVTGHWQAQQDGWYSDGDTAADPSAASYVNQVEWWFWLDAVLVRPNSTLKTVVVLGDSITEGYASTTNANHRYPDYLAARLASRGQFTVANEGVGGNQVVADGTRSGVNVQARLDRDVLSQPNVSTVIYLEGINDIGSGSVTSAGTLIQADKQIIARLHSAGLRVLGGTLTPFKGAGSYSPEREQIRAELNNWIRTSGAFDAVVDFDAATRDPAQPQQFLPRYDAGDHLHPNDAGYQAMAAAVPISAIR